MRVGRWLEGCGFEPPVIADPWYCHHLVNPAHPSKSICQFEATYLAKKKFYPLNQSCNLISASKKSVATSSTLRTAPFKINLPICHWFDSKTLQRYVSCQKKIVLHPSNQFSNMIPVLIEKRIQLHPQCTIQNQFGIMPLIWLQNPAAMFQAYWCMIN